MTAPGITRRRRPFLAPIWIAALAALVAGTVLFVGVRLAALYLTEVSTIVVVRHAEKAATPADDPPLSPAGVARAQRLAATFGRPRGTGTVSAIFASETERARQTAAPLARELGLEVVALPGGDVPALLRRVHELGRGRVSLVVGHANTVPQIVAGLTRGRIRVTLDEADFESIYIVTVSNFGPPSVVRLAY